MALFMVDSKVFKRRSHKALRLGAESVSTKRTADERDRMTRPGEASPWFNYLNWQNVGGSLPRWIIRDIFEWRVFPISAISHRSVGFWVLCICGYVLTCECALVALSVCFSSFSSFNLCGVFIDYGRRLSSTSHCSIFICPTPPSTFCPFF